MSFYEGIEKLIKPHPVTNFTMNYIVLGTSFVFESISWTVAFRRFNETRGRRNLLAAVHASKDPTVFTVLFEDSAALAGLVIACCGLFAVQVQNILWADAAASMLIGVVLTVTATTLAKETKSLLTGEAASAAVTTKIRDILLGDSAIEQVSDVTSMHFGPDDVMAAASITFHPRIALETAQQSIVRLENEIKDSIPVITRMYLSLCAHSAEVQEPAHR